MRSFILPAIAVAIVLGGIWLVSSRPQAQDFVSTQAKSIKMDIEEMTLKAGHLRPTAVDSFM